MPERDPIDLIKEQLTEVDSVAAFHADHEAFKEWHSETKAILEKAFGSKSIHYQNFLALRFREISIKSFASLEVNKINSARFRKDLENAKSILHGGMKELTLDRTLFKKIPTTPKTVEVSIKGEYFLASGLSEAVAQAIKTAFEGTGLTAIHDDETVRRGKTLNHKIEELRRTKFGIYDLSASERSEVLLELGIALGLGREVTILCKKESVLPGSIDQLDRIEYENLSDLTEKLRKKVQ